MQTYLRFLNAVIERATFQTQRAVTDPGVIEINIHLKTNISTVA